MPALHVFDFLRSPDKAPVNGLCVLIGDDYFLQQQALDTILAKASPEGADDVRWFDDTAEWAEVIDEVSTASLFSSDGLQVAVVPNVDKRINNRDPFLKTNKERLEKYNQAEYHPGLMILIANSFPGNTKLYKSLAPANRVIDCRIPDHATWKKDEKETRRKAVKWVATWAKISHQLNLPQDAAQRLLELSHDNAGVVEMNLLKLDLLVEEGSTITQQQVDELVGGWEQKNTFEVVDFALAGKAGQALQKLDNLLRDGEAPQQIFGGLSYVYRQFVRMTRTMQKYRRQGIPGGQSLQSCINDEFGKRANFVRDKTMSQLKQITSYRAGFFMQWLLEADLDLKNRFSKSSLPLEKLLIYLEEDLNTTPGLRK